MENTMNTVKYLVDDTRRKLSVLYNDQEVTSLIARMFNHYFGWNRADLLLNAEITLEGEKMVQISESLEKLCQGVPVQYITGQTFFAGTTFIIKPGVLIPRPETEELVNLIINDNVHRQFAAFNILDLGTGSGCIAVSLARAFRSASVDATDISADALKVAGENAALNKVSVRFLPVNMLDNSQMDALAGYDLIVSNPPYVTESEKAFMHRNVIDHEPSAALFVPDEDPLVFYRAIGSFAFRHLVRPGLLYLEINERFGPEVRQMLLLQGFEKADVLHDIFGKDRFVRAEAKSTMMDSSYWMADKSLP
jgi:release factor glutamine methyltransferase